MKPYITIDKGWFWFEIGWFEGQPFKLFNLIIWETQENWNNQKLDFINVFSFETLRFSFSFGWKGY